MSAQKAKQMANFIPERSRSKWNVSFQNPRAIPPTPPLTKGGEGGIFYIRQAQFANEWFAQDAENWRLTGSWQLANWWEPEVVWFGVYAFWTPFMTTVQMLEPADEDGEMRLVVSHYAYKAIIPAGAADFYRRASGTYFSLAIGIAAAVVIAHGLISLIIADVIDAQTSGFWLQEIMNWEFKYTPGQGDGLLANIGILERLLQEGSPI